MDNPSYVPTSNAHQSSGGAIASHMRPADGVLRRAIQDIREGLARWRLWGLMGWNDILLRYRRSMLGPFWLTISMGIMVAALGFLYGSLFKIPLETYLPFLTLGLLVWGLISGLITDGCTALSGAEGLIKEVRLPYSLHVFRMIWRNLIIFGHNIVVYLIVAAIFGIKPSLATLLVVPGLALVMLNAVSMGLLASIVCARFRDVPQIVSSLLQITFFMTPIIWQPELLKERHFLVDSNPFYHFVEIIRAPLLGQSVQLESWLYAGAVSLLGWLLALVFLGRYRRFIPYWV
jgi:ABC-type polysaccharide/polyol phosphate export permease